MPIQSALLEHPLQLHGQGHLFFTTAPAPIIAYLPIVTPQTIVAFAPIVAPFFTIVGRNSFFSFYKCSWIINICKYTGWTTEYFILKCNTFIDGDVVLDFTAVSNCNIRTYHYILSNYAVFFPIFEPLSIWEKCHIFVPSPISTPSSITAVSWA